jgi:hypothetical protein
VSVLFYVVGFLEVSRSHGAVRLNKVSQDPNTTSLWFRMLPEASTLSSAFKRILRLCGVLGDAG